MPYLHVDAGALVVGAYYAVIRVRSPAPPSIAAIGLVGMLLTSTILPSLA